MDSYPCHSGAVLEASEVLGGVKGKIALGKACISGFSCWLVARSIILSVIGALSDCLFPVAGILSGLVLGKSGNKLVIGFLAKCMVVVSIFLDWDGDIFLSGNDRSGYYL